MLVGLLVGLVVVTTAVVVATRPDGPVAANGGERVHVELCEALAGNDVDAAAATFTNRLHTPLHELATAAQREDRAVAARLLEAKQRVEADLDGDREGLLAALAGLEPTVRDALGVTAIATAPCEGQS